MTKPKVSIITLTYNGLQVLKPCVESIRSYCHDVPLQWIIRENGSTDGSLDYLRALSPVEGHKLDILPMQNVGNFAQMNNEVIDLVESDYILFLNNDIVAQSNFLEPMLKAIEDPKIGSVGAILRYPDGKMQHCGIVFNENGSAFNLGYPFANMSSIDVEKVITKDRLYQAATGACLLVRKADFEAIGRFDTKFDWCFDDVDLCLALTSKLNKPSLVLSGHELIHHESWSKARPANYDALRRLKQKYPDLTGDFWNYGLSSFNEYKK